MSASIESRMRALSLSNSTIDKVSKRPADHPKPGSPTKYRGLESIESNDPVQKIVVEILQFYQKNKSKALGKSADPIVERDRINSKPFQEQVLENLFRAPHERTGEVYTLRCKALAADGRLLQIASRTLQADFKAVKTAVTSDGLSLAFASEELRRHPEIIQAAVGQNPDAIHYKL